LGCILHNFSSCTRLRRSWGQIRPGHAAKPRNLNLNLSFQPNCSRVGRARSFGSDVDHRACPNARSNSGTDPAWCKHTPGPSTLLRLRWGIIELPGPAWRGPGIDFLWFFQLRGPRPPPRRGAAEFCAFLAIKKQQKSTPGPLPAGSGSSIIHHNFGGSAIEGPGVCVFGASDGCLCTGLLRTLDRRRSRGPSF